MLNKITINDEKVYEIETVMCDRASKVVGYVMPDSVIDGLYDYNCGVYASKDIVTPEWNKFVHYTQAVDWLRGREDESND